MTYRNCLKKVINKKTSRSFPGGFAKKQNFARRVISAIMIICLATTVTTGCSKKPKKKAKGKKPAYSKPLVLTKGRKLFVDFDRKGQYEPYFIKGVIYNPMPIGRHPNDRGWRGFEVNRIDNIFDDENRLRRDFALLKEMGCNTIRLWKANSTFKKKKNLFPNHMTKKTLDIAQEFGLKVIAGFWLDTKPPKCGRKGISYRTPNFTNETVRKKHIKLFAKFVKQFKDHPALLFWAIGNATNEDMDPLNFDHLTALYSLADQMAAAAHKVEGKSFHPVAFVNGDIETIGQITYDTADIDMKNLDIWGVNVYRGKSFGDMFTEYADLSEKPLWISEYGLDSYNSVNYTTPSAGGEDQETQAEWVGNLWDEIVANNEIVIGATVKEYSDEWWRPDDSLLKGKSPLTHDYFGFGPKDTNCDGYIDWAPEAPDHFFHEEWFGIMSIEDQTLELDTVIPKKVYYTLKEKFGGS